MVLEEIQTELFTSLVRTSSLFSFYNTIIILKIKRGGNVVYMIKVSTKIILIALQKALYCLAETQREVLTTSVEKH